MSVFGGCVCVYIVGFYIFRKKNIMWAYDDALSLLLPLAQLLPKLPKSYGEECCL